MTDKYINHKDGLYKILETETWLPSHNFFTEMTRRFRHDKKKEHDLYRYILRSGKTVFGLIDEESFVFDKELSIGLSINFDESKATKIGVMFL